MNNKMTGPGNFFKGVLSDLGSAGIVLIFVFILTMVLGVIYVLLAVFGKGLAFLGAFLSLCMVPVILIIGVILNSTVFKRPKYKFRGLLGAQKVEPVYYSTRYRNSFILQRFTTLGIMIGIFLVTMFLTAIFAILPFCCVICFPVVYPLVLITITVPAIAWVSFAFAFDPYEPEPRAFLIIGIIWGMLSCFPSLFFNTFNDSWMSRLGMDPGVFSAPVVEEFFKSLGFILLYSQIDDETDGIIYGCAFGAGFALLENFLYGANMLASLGGIGFAFLISFRSFFNVLVHMIGPAIIGFLIGAGKVALKPRLSGSPEGGNSYLILYLPIIWFLVLFGYLISMANHALWNFLAGFGNLLVLLFLSIPLGIFELFMFIGMVLLSFFLGTRRFNRRLKAYRTKGEVIPPPGWRESP